MASPLTFSFELFPPRTPEGVSQAAGRDRPACGAAAQLFFRNHGAGGSDQDGTYETLVTVVEHSGVEAAPHLTCVGSTRAHVAALLERYREAGVKRIVALRGDLPATAMSPAAPGEFHYANELVSFIRADARRCLQDRGGRLPRDASPGRESRLRTSSTSAAKWKPARTRR